MELKNSYSTPKMDQSSFVECARPNNPTSSSSFRIKSPNVQAKPKRLAIQPNPTQPPSSGVNMHNVPYTIIANPNDATRMLSYPSKPIKPVRHA